MTDATFYLRVSDLPLPREVTTPWLRNADKEDAIQISAWRDYRYSAVTWLSVARDDDDEGRHRRIRRGRCVAYFGNDNGDNDNNLL